VRSTLHSCMCTEPPPRTITAEAVADENEQRNSSTSMGSGGRRCDGG